MDKNNKNYFLLEIRREQNVSLKKYCSMIFVFRKQLIRGKDALSSTTKYACFACESISAGDDIHCHRCRGSSQLTRRYPRDCLPTRYHQRFRADANGKSFISPLRS
jgi:hypothetical protein